MTGNYNSQRFDKEQKHFGGLIFPSDWNLSYVTDRSNRTHPYGSSIAQRIESDFKREQQLQKTNL